MHALTHFIQSSSNLHGYCITHHEIYVIPATTFSERVPLCVSIVLFNNFNFMRSTNNAKRQSEIENEHEKNRNKRKSNAKNGML